MEWNYTKAPKDGKWLIVVLKYEDHVGTNVVRELCRWDARYGTFDGYLNIKIDDEIIKCWMYAPEIPSALVNGH